MLEEVEENHDFFYKSLKLLNNNNKKCVINDLFLLHCKAFVTHEIYIFYRKQ